jgi:hypothetical protein
MKRQRSLYLILGMLVVAAGVASRTFHSGVPLLDKYLGDALYAVLIYLLISAAWPGVAARRRALVAFGLVAAIEVFQLTGVPAQLARSGSPALQIAAIVLGTKFSWYDLLAYAAGTGMVYLLEWALEDVARAKAVASRG